MVEYLIASLPAGEYARQRLESVASSGFAEWVDGALWDDPSGASPVEWIMNETTPSRPDSIENHEALLRIQEVGLYKLLAWDEENSDRHAQLIETRGIDLEVEAFSRILGFSHSWIDRSDSNYHELIRDNEYRILTALAALRPDIFNHPDFRTNQLRDRVCEARLTGSEWPFTMADVALAMNARKYRFSDLIEYAGQNGGAEALEKMVREAVRKKPEVLATAGMTKVMSEAYYKRYPGQAKSFLLWASEVSKLSAVLPEDHESRGITEQVALASWAFVAALYAEVPSDEIARDLDVSDLLRLGYVRYDPRFIAIHEVLDGIVDAVKMHELPRIEGELDELFRNDPETDILPLQLWLPEQVGNLLQ